MIKINFSLEPGLALACKMSGVDRLVLFALIFIKSVFFCVKTLTAGSIYWANYQWFWVLSALWHFCQKTQWTNYWDDFFFIWEFGLAFPWYFDPNLSLLWEYLGRDRGTEQTVDDKKRVWPFEHLRRLYRLEMVATVIIVVLSIKVW